LRADLAQGRYREGVQAAIDAIEQVCLQHCPSAPAPANELPDEPVLL
jgi:uncharacterized membrane protein